MTIELDAGMLREPRMEDYITKITAVNPAPPGTPAPIWSKFLKRATNEDSDLIAYLQRVAGYCMTGLVTEHVLFFLYGTGANGKGVFLNTLLGIWGDYGIAIGTDMLMVSKTDRHPTEVARLRGVRLAVGSEVEVGRTWAESKIKALTGGDRLQGRFMRQDFFEFDPHFKLVISGNHRPSLRDVDEAIRRRLHLIPFTVTIPVAERDKGLQDKLKAEWPAILRWAVDGCLEWQRTGLRPPKAVTDATDEYLDSEDATARWLEECCKRDVNAVELSGILFASWRRWAERAGEFVGSQKRLSQKLKDRGFNQKKSGTGLMQFVGLRALNVEEPERWAA